VTQHLLASSRIPLADGTAVVVLTACVVLLLRGGVDRAREQQSALPRGAAAGVEVLLCAALPALAGALPFVIGLAG
jgi:hypothetical protein